MIEREASSVEIQGCVRRKLAARAQPIKLGFVFGKSLGLSMYGMSIAPWLGDHGAVLGKLIESLSKCRGLALEIWDSW